MIVCLKLYGEDLGWGSMSFNLWFLIFMLLKKALHSSLRLFESNGIFNVSQASWYSNLGNIILRALRWIDSKSCDCSFVNDEDHTGHAYSQADLIRDR